MLKKDKYQLEELKRLIEEKNKQILKNVTALLIILLGWHGIAVLYFVYKYTLSGETLFRLNRIIILSIVLLSIILPVWTITIFKEIAAPAVLNKEVFIADSSNSPEINQQINDNDWFSVIQIIALCVYLLVRLA